MTNAYIIWQATGLDLRTTRIKVRCLYRSDTTANRRLGIHGSVNVGHVISNRRLFCTIFPYKPFPDRFNTNRFTDRFQTVVVPKRPLHDNRRIRSCMAVRSIVFPASFSLPPPFSLPEFPASFCCQSYYIRINNNNIWYFI